MSALPSGSFKEFWEESADAEWWNLSVDTRRAISAAIDDCLTRRRAPIKLPIYGAMSGIVIPPYVIVLDVRGDEMTVLEIRRW